MISLLIFALIVTLVVALAVWAIRSLPIVKPFNTILIVIVCLIGILVVANRAGVF